MLTLIQDTGKRNKDYRKIGLYKCDCGNIKEIDMREVKRGQKSCGCANITHDQNGKKNVSFKHGRTHSPEHRSWGSMIQRCYQENATGYHNYGARGIRVCDRWLGDEGFVNFYKDMGKRPSLNHSLDRIDVNGDYTPENCKWSTSKEQSIGRRDSVYITYGGQTKHVSQWSKEVNISPNVLAYRKRSGWNVEDILFKPLRKTKRSVN